MSNPFGEYNEEDEFVRDVPQKTSTPVRVSSSSRKNNTNTTTNKKTMIGGGGGGGGNPFGDEDELEAELVAATAMATTTTTTTSTISSFDQSFNDLSIGLQQPPSGRQSRQSISSSTSETSSNHSFLIGNYSLGDGNLQKEGLLCPECLAEFRTITELIQHSETAHIASSNSNATSNAVDLPGQVSGQIKDLFNKFRNKAKFGGNRLNDLDTLWNDVRSGVDVGGSGDISQTEQSNPIEGWKHYMIIGPSRNHMDHFRQRRETRIERYVFETNKLLIRLDKLLRDYPPLNDPIRRREHEQSVVPWIDDSMVNLCPSCASKFNILTRKKHHCRLCGAVMCAKCSQFIDFDYARKLIAPISLDTGGQLGPQQQPLLRISPSNNVPNISTSSTNLSTTLFSLVASDLNAEMAEMIRICRDCKFLLTMRREKLDMAYIKPDIQLLYNKLRTNTDEIKRLLPILEKMSVSLNSGETTYTLVDANELKRELTRLGENADSISRKIESFGVIKIPPPPDDPTGAPTMKLTISQRQLRLQTAIRRATINFLRNSLLGMPELPDEQKFAQLRLQHEEMLQKRIEYEKEIILREQQYLQQQQSNTKLRTTNVPSRHTNNNNNNNTDPDHQQPIIISIDDGFCPQSSSTDLWKNMSEEERKQIMNDKSDPMVQQMSIIRSYIRQARQDHRYEEVAMLEENLKELEIEYYFQQQQQKNILSLSSSSSPPPAATQQQREYDSNASGGSDEARGKGGGNRWNPFDDDDEDK